MADNKTPHSSKGLVLVTGANGFIGANVVYSLLSAGYSVRGSVRSVTRAAPLLEEDSPLATFAAKGQFSLVEVSDITAPDAFKAAMEGNVTAVVHLAQPVTMSSDDPDYVIGTAVRGTQNILETAAHVESLKTFVLMSSVAALRPTSQQDGVVSAENWSDADGLAEALQKQNKPVPGPLVYAASKAAGERALWKFRDTKNPKFSITSLNPVFVAGPPVLRPKAPEDISGTSKFIYDILAGQDFPPAERRVGYGAYVDVRDVARLAVFAVEHPDVADKQRYLSVSSWVHPQGVADVLRKSYPDRANIIKEGSAGQGYTPGFKLPVEGLQYDWKTVVDATGTDLIPFEKTIVDAAKVYETLL
ncbi:NAD dependent epimerase/dehydratase [Xylariales sp. PMI_506]|nr:NAD dependent epimerase/dehydratase [Xylariales sp. PMI_506]